MRKCRDCVVSLLGVCHGDFCRAECVGLVERAEEMTERLGHELDDFVKIENRPLWQSQCRRCGLQVTFTIDPEPGRPALWGDGVTTRCPTAGPVSDPPAAENATG